ncbi:response regulator [Amaricoccus solimangrovi]|uniref:Response regulator transcription factor n=1 Tax=Amaricoccus solimangrovi TaxID=2589815 RepID=A0A501WQJ9_9RHOB|nr:response regulator transcription factor [Amaricoccus solimangrovi]TPE51749.1 response regulator transcription factor [Amaricoccus solimangrovi]
MRILIVEDDELLQDGLAVGLRLAGFVPEVVGTLADAGQALSSGAFDAVVLDVMLPDGSGLDFLRGLRTRGARTPVLVLTALDGLGDRIAGLDTGADDYLGKPFELDELAARLRAILRRGDGRARAELVWNGLALDPARMVGSRGGAEVAFSRKEFVILHALMQHPTAILSRAALEERVYGWQEEVESNAVEVHVHKLRAKLGAGFIETVRGAGYRLAAEEGAG